MSRNQTTPTKKKSQSPLSIIHRLLSTQRAREAHTEKAKNPGRPSSPQQDNTVPLLLLLRNNKQRWVPQPQPSQQPPSALALQLSLSPLPLPQFQQHLLPPQEQLNQELTTALGTLWQPLYAERALGAHQAEEEAEDQEEEKVEDNQPPSPHNNSSPSQLLQIYTSWECSPESSKGKEKKPTAS